MNTPIPLDRRFRVWNEQDSEAAALMRRWNGSGDGLRWADLLKHRRVVLLCEAGGGKSTELEEQARLQEAADRYAFFATLQRVAARGLAEALPAAQARRFEQWRQSGDPAWLFIDSIDEAKGYRVHFRDALQAIADAIEGAQGRAHIILSGRPADWEVHKDLVDLEEVLLEPPPDQAVPALSPDDLVIKAIRRELPHEKPPAAEPPLVVVMEPLDQDRVEIYARGRGVAQFEPFREALDRANLWEFARRPLDLDWLVPFWLDNGRFGSLQEMLDLSLLERLRETDRDRERRDPLDVNRTIRALERVGAGLVLGGSRDIAIPESPRANETVPALDLWESLPDWNGEDLTRLINRAVFEPAAIGLVRLHNDNEGVVRGYLTACWLKRLLEANCPKTAARDLLFSTTYGVHLVIPSMRETAAWLALWSPETTREIERCDPRLLMQHGDPGSLSIPVRQRVLKAVIEDLSEDAQSIWIPKLGPLRRFTAPELAPLVRDLWATHQDQTAPRLLLLAMVAEGALKECADIVAGAAFQSYTDANSQIIAGRALLATASDTERQRYAKHIEAHAREMSQSAVWEAVEHLFPMDLSVDALVSIVNAVNITDRSGAFPMDYQGTVLVNRLEQPRDIERLMDGLLGRRETWSRTRQDQGAVTPEPLLLTLVAGAERLLELCDDTKVPAVAVRVMLELGASIFKGSWHRDNEEFVSRFRITPERRRETLWQVAKLGAVSPLLQGKPLRDSWHLHVLHVPPQLEYADLEWLIGDLEEREDANERHLALTAALSLWRDHGRQAQDLVRIQRAAQDNTDLTAVIVEWTTERGETPAEKELRRRREELEQQSVVRRAEQDQSWVQFAESLRSKPDQLRTLHPPTDDGLMDRRLYDVWQLLQAIGPNSNHYAIGDLSVLNPMFGEKVVEAIADAFVRYWRLWTPRLRAERAEPNTILSVDCVGLVGVTIEAGRSDKWASTLSPTDAARAATYATLELNGFPAWFTRLAEAQPKAVRDVLARAIALEAAGDGLGGRCENLDRVANADAAIGALVADDLFKHVRDSAEVPEHVLKPALRILSCTYTDTDALAALVRARVEQATDPAAARLYFSTLFEVDETLAVQVLDNKLQGLSPADASMWGQRLLGSLFGWPGLGRGVDLRDLTFTDLEWLVHLAFRLVPQADDKDTRRSVGVNFGRTDREQAQSARDALFNVLVTRPGAATVAALGRFMDDQDNPIAKDRLQELIMSRVQHDCEPDPWLPKAVCQFETEHQAMPGTPRALQQLVLSKLKDLQHDLLHSDFAQGTIVANLPDEKAVQKWMAEHFERESRGSYNTVREDHVVDEKEPDIRFLAHVSTAKMPMEIKLAEKWSTHKLEEALTDQLVGQYLRDRENRYGILLLVYRKPRKDGWRKPEGGFFQFQELVERLRELAEGIAEKDTYAPQPVVAVIDVSNRN